MIGHKAAPEQNMKELLLVTLITYEQQNSVRLLLSPAIRHVFFSLPMILI